MPRSRQNLPQLGNGCFLTDGGIETTLIFLEGWELPYFAAFDLLQTREGEAALRNYFRTYAALSQRFGTGLILESATWRASADWGSKLGYGTGDLTKINQRAVKLLEDLRGEMSDDDRAIVISGCVGPRGDGYVAEHCMSAAEAEAYHQSQIQAFADSAADMVTAITMNYVDEAIGIARAAEKAGMPAAISLTVETDGCLPTGETIRGAIEKIDAATSGYPAYYMINCAHPTHFADALAAGETWLPRIRGLRANASRKSHAELNESPDLDIGNPAELGAQYAQLKSRLPNLNVLGGCCGTDHRHVEQIAAACVPLFR